VELAGPFAVRRVCLEVKVYLAAVSWRAGLAQVEAVAAVESALAPLGAVVDVSDCRSTPVRYGPRPAPPGENADAGDQT
jgi:hypothetical protein